jgi:hypothetical protein
VLFFEVLLLLTNMKKVLFLLGVILPTSAIGLTFGRGFVSGMKQAVKKLTFAPRRVRATKGPRATKGSGLFSQGQRYDPLRDDEEDDDGDLETGAETTTETPAHISGGDDDGMMAVTESELSQQLWEQLWEPSGWATAAEAQPDSPCGENFKRYLQRARPRSPYMNIVDRAEREAVLEDEQRQLVEYLGPQPALDCEPMVKSFVEQLRKGLNDIAEQSQGGAAWTVSRVNLIVRQLVLAAKDMQILPSFSFKRPFWEDFPFEQRPNGTQWMPSEVKGLLEEQIRNLGYIVINPPGEGAGELRVALDQCGSLGTAPFFRFWALRASKHPFFTSAEALPPKDRIAYQFFTRDAWAKFYELRTGFPAEVHDPTWRREHLLNPPKVRDLSIPCNVWHQVKCEFLIPHKESSHEKQDREEWEKNCGHSRAMTFRRGEANDTDTDN